MTQRLMSKIWEQLTSADCMQSFKVEEHGMLTEKKRHIRKHFWSALEHDTN